MSAIVFISDLHLDHTRPNTIALFQAFLAQLSPLKSGVQALYILGDLFDAWPGDDALTHPDFSPIIQSLSQASRTGLAIYLMHGNRDFLMGADFAKYCNITLLADPTQLDIIGKKIMLSHGDCFCTDDIEYQTFKKQVRSTEWQSNFLAQPLSTRLAYIASLRAQSEMAKSEKTLEIMDVNESAIEAHFVQNPEFDILIHGHTHRPKLHPYQYQNRKCERWVLPDWDETGGFIRLDDSGKIKAYTFTN